MPYCEECENWFSPTNRKKVKQLEDALQSQREATLYLLKELGFDVTILQGSGGVDLPLDDMVVTQAFKQQISKRIDVWCKHAASNAYKRATVDNGLLDKGECAK